MTTGKINPQRVVVTGLGVITSNGHGLDAFEKSLREGRSGIRFHEKLKELAFGCQVGGNIEGLDEIKRRYFSEDLQISMRAGAIALGAIAAVDCWRDAGFEVPGPGDDRVDIETGAIVGTGVGGGELIVHVVGPMVAAGKARRMGTAIVEQIMMSGVSARIGGILGLGGQVTTNSSACNTGTEAIVEAFHKVRNGLLSRVLAGGVEGDSYHVWACFDAMRILASTHNHNPAAASRPLSATAAGFVPGSGAALLMLESLESAERRGARIHAELLGGHVNSGGHRRGGSITGANPHRAKDCIVESLRIAGIRPGEVDAINGHLTATSADPREVRTWQQALGCAPERLPWINSTKSLIGHALGAAGAIETVAAILQLERGFLHGSINCEDLHAELAPFSERVVHRTMEKEVSIIAKSSFGFGNVNGCLILGKWKGPQNG